MILYGEYGVATEVDVGDDLEEVIARVVGVDEYFILEAGDVHVFPAQMLVNFVNGCIPFGRIRDLIGEIILSWMDMAVGDGDHEVDGSEV